MSGISRIQTKRETRYQGGQEDTRMPGRELFFKDGDQENDNSPDQSSNHDW